MIVFVERHLVSDYRTLHTRFNPFRFRSGIVREAGRALRDPLTLRALAEGNLREGRAGDLASAERMVRTDLVEILAIFEGLDPHLDAVASVVARLERRIAATLRYREPRDSARIERTAAALRAAGAAPDDAFPAMPAPEVSLLRPPIGPPQLTNPRMPRRAIESEPLPEIETDPAIEAFVVAKDAFRRRTTVTPERIVAFLDAHLKPGRRLRGSDITIADVDAFVVFQRLREIDVLFDGSLRDRYRLAPGEGRLANGWIDCPDFSIERVAEPKNHEPKGRRPAAGTR